jgi:transcriptional regulator with XRE-family HTH domain
VNIALIIRQRLKELRLEQKDLAAVAGVTDSYISQLLTRKKLPPLSGRTDIYPKMEKFLKLPRRTLVDLAMHERTEELKKKLPGTPVPLYKEVRELVLRKCASAKRKDVLATFEKQPFGELERLVTQKLLEVAKKAARQELESEAWLKMFAQLNGRSYQEMRVSILEFLDADVFNISNENCVFFLEPLIDSWDIDLGNFGIEIVLNRRLAPGQVKKLEFVEMQPPVMPEEEPGLKEFLLSTAMSGNATDDEIEFLKNLSFKSKKSRPTALYYYRELQNLRDPLHFTDASVSLLHKYGDTKTLDRQTGVHDRVAAIERWAQNKGKQSRKRRKPKTRQR